MSISRQFLRSAVAAAVIALTGSPGWAAVRSCLIDEGGRPLRRVWVEHFFDNRLTDVNGCVTFPDNNPIDVRVHAHNPVIRIDDGTAAAIAVSQVVRLVDGSTVAIPAQSAFYRLAGRFRTAYNEGLREFSAWGGGEFPAGTTRTTNDIIRGVWPDASVAVRAFTEPSSLGTGFPLIHLKNGDQGDLPTIAHELGHALHFEGLSTAKRVEVGARFLAWLAVDEEKIHCFERRTEPMIAFVEAFGQFAETYRGTTLEHAATGPVRHGDFFQEAEALEPRLFIPNDDCEDREDGPMFGDDVEGAVFMTLFHDFAMQVGLDFVVTSYVTCQSLDIHEYAQCIKNDQGADSRAFQELVAAGANYGITFANTGLDIGGKAEAADRFGAAVARGDFNGDGYQDLAIGVPRENVGDVANAGAVNVLYGTRSGLIVARNQIWDQTGAGVAGGAEAGDLFGAALAAGDFDRDGFDDLAIGVPGQDVNGIGNAGAVAVLYGSRTGLVSDGAQTWHQGSLNVPDQSEAGDNFGASLVAGDFNGDRFVDLAIGAPLEDLDYTLPDAGQVTVIYGSFGALGQLNSGLIHVWNQDSPDIEGTAAAGAAFGSSLAAGDFDGDTDDDLAIGVPKATVGSAEGAGAVSVIYGILGSRLGAADDQLWTEESPGITRIPEAGENFGARLATGDFDGDGRDDLAIGAPNEDVSTMEDAGSVFVMYGSTLRLTAGRIQFWTQDTGGVDGIAGFAIPNDHFGASLATGDINGDGLADLAIGVPGEDVASQNGAGAVAVIYGRPAHTEQVVIGGRIGLFPRPAGLDMLGNELRTQGGGAEEGDAFGSAVAVGNFNQDDFDDLAVGVPFENVGSVSDAGTVNVFRGSANGVSSTNIQTWHQDR